MKYTGENGRFLMILKSGCTLRENNCLAGNCIFLYSQLITFSAIRGNHIFDKAHLHFLICAAITFYPLRGNHMFTLQCNGENAITEQR
jgi:hypothetical protein